MCHDGQQTLTRSCLKAENPNVERARRWQLKGNSCSCMKTLKQRQWTNGRLSEKWTPWLVDYSCWGSIFHIFFWNPVIAYRKLYNLRTSCGWKIWHIIPSTLCGPSWIQIMMHSQNRLSIKEILDTELLPTTFDPLFAPRLFTLLSADLSVIVIL